MIRSAVSFTFALALLCGSSAAQGANATIQVLRGRAVVQDGAQAQTLLRSQDFSSSGPLQLEIGAGSEVEIRWLGVASMHVWGPTSMAWSDDEQGDVGWSFTDLAWADLEVRRGEHRLDLPGAWRTRVAASALHLRGLPSGPVELRHHAGPALMLEWHGDPTRIRPPVAVYAGSSLRLEALAPSGDRSARSSRPMPREEPTAAMELAHAPPVQVRVRGQERATTVPVERARQPEFVSVQEISVETTTRDQDPQQDAVQAQPMERGDAEVASETHVVTEQPEAPRSGIRTRVPATGSLQVVVAPVQATQTQETKEDPWHGVQASELNRAGPLWIERAAGTEVRVTTSGSWKVFVDRNAAGPVWCFGPEQDVQIFPGGIVSFAPDGELKLKFGKVQVAPAPSWRQSLEVE